MRIVGLYCAMICPVIMISLASCDEKTEAPDAQVSEAADIDANVTDKPIRSSAYHKPSIKKGESCGGLPGLRQWMLVSGKTPADAVVCRRYGDEHKNVRDFQFHRLGKEQSVLLGCIGESTVPRDLVLAWSSPSSQRSAPDITQAKNAIELTEGPENAFTIIRNRHHHKVIDIEYVHGGKTDFVSLMPGRFFTLPKLGQLKAVAYNKPYLAPPNSLSCVAPGDEVAFMTMPGGTIEA